MERSNRGGDVKIKKLKLPKRIDDTKDELDIDNEPIVISQHCLKLLLKQKYKVDLIAIYTFYYHTTKWQKTNQVKATTLYVSKVLGITEERVRRAKKILISLGLIKDMIRRDDNGMITGRYIRVNFIWTKEEVKKVMEKIEINHTMEKPKYGEINHTMEKPYYGETTTSALSVGSKSALSVGREKEKEKYKKEKNFETNKASIKNEVTTNPLFKKEETVGTPIKKRAKKISIDYSCFSEKFRNNEKFMDTFIEFEDARREDMKKPMTQRIAKRLADKFSAFSIDSCIKGLEHSIISKYPDVYPENFQQTNGNYKNKYQNNNSDYNETYQKKERVMPLAPDGYYYDRNDTLQRDRRYDDVTVEDTNGYDDYND